MKRRIKESKNIFPCTVYMENQDYDEVYYYLDTPEYGLSWRYFDDVEQEDVENYKYIIKNIADLRKAIDDLEEDFIYGYGTKYFKLSGNYMEDLLNRGKTLVHISNVDSKDTVFIIKVKPAQNVELAAIKESTKDYARIVEDGVTAIEEEAFRGSGATEIIIPDSVTTIGKRAFKDCERLKTIDIPESVTSIGKCAFLNCSRLPSIIIPSSVTSIEAFTFSQCYKLKSIEIPNSVTSIGAYAFETCHKLESIEIPKSVTYIGPGAFRGCINLQSINIPKGVTAIKEETFFSCHKLTEVIIPDSITSIENDAFYGCESLTTINYTGTRDQWNAIEKDPTWREKCPQNMVINYNYQESSFDKGSVELALAESFEKTIKNLQREGLFENVKSFDLDFTGKGINIKLNESINSYDTPFLFFLKTKQYLCEEFFKQLYGVDNNNIVTNFQKEVIKKCNISVNEFKGNTLWGIYFSHLTPFIKEEDIFRIIEDHNGESLLQKEFGSVEALKECMNRIDLLRPDSQAFERMKKFFSLFISDVEDWKNKIWNKTWSENLNLLSGYILGNINWRVLDDKIKRSSKSSESSKTSTTPFMDEIFSLAQNIYIFDEIIDKWPDSYDYYSEVAESVGDDYDDIKDRFDFDQLNLRDCIEFITEHDGENIAKKMFGTIENIQKSFEEYDSNEDVKNVLTQFVDYFRDDLNEYEEQYWRECIDSAVSDWNAYYSGDDNDY